MVRVAFVFALAAAVEGARITSEEVGAALASGEADANFEDAGFDYEAADALDWDEDLAAGDFNFEESVEAGVESDDEQMFPCPTGRVKAAFSRGCATVLSDNGRGRCQLRFDDGRTDEMHAMHLEHSPSCPQVVIPQHIPQQANGWTCSPGQGGSGQSLRSTRDNSFFACSAACAASRRCDGFDFTTRGAGDACRFYDSGNRVRQSPGSHNRQYCYQAHGPNWHAPQPVFQGGSAMAGSFMVADGCRRSQGSSNPEIRSAMGGFASVRCCSNNGRRCESTSIGCLQHQTLAQATAACSRRNMRLCSVQELDSGVCCGTGCGFDGHHIWTMTPAGGMMVGQNGHGININVNAQHGFSGSSFNGGGFHNQVSDFVIADGCLRNQGRQQARTRNAITGRASVRCCSFDGRRCETQQVGCLEGVSFNQATAACSQRGLRLCEQNELEGGVCCGTGCGFDGRRVWTSTPAR